MSTILVRLSIPERIRGDMLLKTGGNETFDIPYTQAGVKFAAVWDEMSKPRRDALMKFAYERNLDIVAAHDALAKAEASALGEE
jgi:hypothetical protein